MVRDFDALWNANVDQKRGKEMVVVEMAGNMEAAYPVTSHPATYLR